MQHQRQGVEFLISHEGGGLLWEPGTGKTLTVISYLDYLVDVHDRAAVLVTAPLSAVDTWPDEIAKHLNLPNVRVTVLTGSGKKKIETLNDLEPLDRGLDVIVVNLDIFSQSHKYTSSQTVRGKFCDVIRRWGFDLMVVDESHRIKGHNSNMSRAIGSLARFLPQRIILTGTVAPHSPLDIFAQWRFLNPERFGTRKASFEGRYAILGGWHGKQVIGFQNQKELNRKRSMDSVVVLKKDALDLPPVTSTTHHVTLTPKERKAYNDLATHMMLDEGPDGEPYISANALTQWLRLRQLTSGHLTDGDAVKHLGDSKIKHAADLVSDLVSAGQQVVVFAHFVDDIRRMTIALEKSKINVQMIYGATPGEERRDIRKSFYDGGTQVVVAQMRTVSLAINEFVVANHAVYLSMSERRDDYIQSRDRLIRKGQENPVTLHHMIVRDSIDEIIMQAHAEKGRLEAFILARLDQITKGIAA